MDKIVIDAKIVEEGIEVSLDGKPYIIGYPKEVWENTPIEIKDFLKENLAFATTHFLPVMLKREVVYNTAKPFLEPHLFMNQFYDMTSSEDLDEVPPLTYLKEFYNQEFSFKKCESAIPRLGYQAEKTAVIPFTFGKESLVTLGLCRELGIKPILVYCQEPSHQYEEEYKKKKLKDLEEEFNVVTYFIRNDTGLFRYGEIFNIPSTELGWGSQTTTLTLLSMPFIYYHKARYILYGNEHQCNDYFFKSGWKVYNSGFDQTSSWTQHQRNMIRIITDDSCAVNTSLEPLDVLPILFMLHNRYPELGKLQFSCHAKNPLYKNSQWCHNCFKCRYMYLFALALKIDPSKIGFVENIIDNADTFNYFFDVWEENFQSWDDFNLAFYLLFKRGVELPDMRRFKAMYDQKQEYFDKLPDSYLRLRPSKNLPKEYKSKLFRIFKQEFETLKKVVY